MASFKIIPPEIREIIYEYAFAFDTPLCHVNRMQPFVKKLTGVEGEIRVASCFLQRDPEAFSGPDEEFNFESEESNRDSDSELYNDSDSEPTSDHDNDYEDENYSEHSSSCSSDSDHEDEQKCVNTAILTVDRRTYKEGIAVFFKINVIHIDFDLIHMNMTSPRGSDLSLATRVLTRAAVPLDSIKVLQAKDLEPTVAALSNMLPLLSEATLRVSTDSGGPAVTQLFESVKHCRAEALHVNARFNGIACVAADVHPKIRVIMKYEEMVKHWQQSANDPYPDRQDWDGPPSWYSSRTI